MKLQSKSRYVKLYPYLFTSHNAKSLCHFYLILQAQMKQKLNDMLNPEELQQYAISGDFDGEISKVGKIPKSGIVSIKADENRKIIVDDKKSTKRKKEHGKTKSKKFKR